MEEEIGKTALEILKGLSKDIYSDAVSPGMKQVGKALETVGKLGNTILTSVTLLNEGTKAWRDNVIGQWQEKMKGLPMENVKPIDGEIVAPVLKKLEYTTSEELVDMFLNLLTSAADNQKESIVHPSFTNIIGELSTDEAKILRFMKNEREPICTTNIRVRYNNGNYSDHFHDTTIFDCTDVLKFKNNTKTYLENLKRLGLIKEWGIPKGTKQYELIEEHLAPNFDVLKSEKGKIKSMNFCRRYYDFTELGKNFINSCLPN